MDSLETEKAINEMRVAGSLFLTTVFKEKGAELTENPQLLETVADLVKTVMNRT